MSFRLALSKRDFNHYFKKVQLTSDSQLTFAWSPSSRRVVGRSVRCRPLSTGSVSRRDRVRDGQIRGAGGGALTIRLS